MKGFSGITRTARRRSTGCGRVPAIQVWKAGTHETGYPIRCDGRRRSFRRDGCDTARTRRLRGGRLSGRLTRTDLRQRCPVAGAPPGEPVREHGERGGRAEPRRGQHLRQQGRDGRSREARRFVRRWGRRTWRVVRRWGHRTRHHAGLPGRRLRQRCPAAGPPPGERQRQQRERRRHREPGGRQRVRQRVRRGAPAARRARAAAADPARPARGAAASRSADRSADAGRRAPEGVPEAASSLAHTGADATLPAVAGSAVLLLGGLALQRRFRPHTER